MFIFYLYDAKNPNGCSLTTVFSACKSTQNLALPLFSCHHHSIGDNLHPLSPLKILFRGKFVLRNEYLLDSVQVVLFRIGAKTLIFRTSSAHPAPIIPVFRNDLSRFSAEALHSRQHFHNWDSYLTENVHFCGLKD